MNNDDRVCTYDIIETDRPSLEEDLSGPAGVDGEPQLDDVQADILVKRVQYQLAHTAVVPGTVYEEQSLQKAKLGYRVVRGTGCLQTLHTRNP